MSISKLTADTTQVWEELLIPSFLRHLDGENRSPLTISTYRDASGAVCRVPIFHG